jgi:hypothetical protein
MLALNNSNKNGSKLMNGRQVVYGWCHYYLVIHQPSLYARSRTGLYDVAIIVAAIAISVFLSFNGRSAGSAFDFYANFIARECFIGGSMAFKNNLRRRPPYSAADIAIKLLALMFYLFHFIN